ncbi:hypothetical protein [Pleurocapsa sp. FMAR1]|uniref:hypothetical protein n=1 Tax=Pleurocapsa sp. FMAR1 TaxID=3040204 RepID=UPI0029C8E298|nr:hypothetical protein [Pleurocapsa sp. FMAR1]
MLLLHAGIALCDDRRYSLSLVDGFFGGGENFAENRTWAVVCSMGKVLMRSVYIFMVLCLEKDKLGNVIICISYQSAKKMV